VNQYYIIMFILMNTFLVDLFFNSYIFGLVYFLFFPGYLLLTRSNRNYSVSESLILSVVLSSTIIVFYSQYLAFLGAELSSVNLFIMNGLFVFFFSFKKIRENKVQMFNPRTFLKTLYDERTQILISLIILSLPLLLYKNITMHDFYMGLDPYRNISVTRSIENSVNILGSSSFDNPFFGFYFFIVSVKAMLNLSTHLITKYFWIANASILLGLLYLTIKKSYKSAFIGIVPLFFLSNGFVLDRLVMSIRENYSITILMGFIFFMNKANEENNYIDYIPELAILFCGVFNSHPITFVFASFYLCWVLMYNRFILKNDKHFEILKILLGVLFAFPVLVSLTKWYLWFVSWKINTLLGWGIPTHPGGLNTDAIKQAWTRAIQLTDFNKITIILFPLGLLTFLRTLHTKIRSAASFIIPWTITITLLVILTEMGLYTSPSRLVIYIALSLSFFSGFFLDRVYDYIQNTNIDISLGITLSQTQKRFILSSKVIAVLCVSLIFIPVVYTSISTIDSYRKYSPYEGGQVRGAEAFLSSIPDSNYTLIPHPDDIGLMPFVGSKNFVYNYTQIGNVFNSNSISDLDSIIDTYNSSNVYILISNRRFNSRQFSLYQLLDDDYFSVLKYESINVYKIS